LSWELFALKNDARRARRPEEPVDESIEEVLDVDMEVEV
jgi:hypothetical protein